MHHYFLLFLPTSAFLGIRKGQQTWGKFVAHIYVAIIGYAQLLKTSVHVSMVDLAVFQDFFSSFSNPGIFLISL